MIAWRECPYWVRHLLNDDGDRSCIWKCDKVCSITKEEVEPVDAEFGSVSV